MTRRLVIWLVALVTAAVPAALAAPADADPAGGTVALLPLDAAAHLELYGQPVASELARELAAGGVEVVVVGPKMAVPERAQLVVDGTITAGKGTTVVLSVRIRDRATGSVLDRLEATAPELTHIDRAASDVSARLLPAVKAQLAAVDHAHDHPVATPAHPAAAAAAPAAPVPALAVTIAAKGPLHDAFAPQLAAWVEQHHWRVAAHGAAATIELTPLAYRVTPGTIALARARVRVRIAAGTQRLFDRVVVTDTVVGDKGLPPDQLAARTARAVLDIVEPHMRQAVATWHQH